MVINNVTKFHKIPIKTTGLKDRTLSNMVIYQEQMPMILEGMV